MIKSIRHMGISEAEQYIRTKLTDISKQRTALISIREPRSTYEFPYHLLKDGNWLMLRFDDAVQADNLPVFGEDEIDWVEFQLFTKEQSIQVKDFVDILHNSDEEYDLIIHCHAGVSRSTAIAKAVADYIDIPYLKMYTLHNKLVYRIQSETFDEYEG